MGYARHPAIGRLFCLAGSRLAMAGRDTQSSADQFVDHGGGHAFRGQRYHRAAAAPETPDSGEFTAHGQAYLRFRMNTLARSVERRPLEMETEYPGNLQAGL